MKRFVGITLGLAIEIDNMSEIGDLLRTLENSRIKVNRIEVADSYQPVTFNLPENLNNSGDEMLRMLFLSQRTSCPTCTQPITFEEFKAKKCNKCDGVI